MWTKFKTNLLLLKWKLEGWGEGGYVIWYPYNCCLIKKNVKLNHSLTKLSWPCSNCSKNILSTVFLWWFLIKLLILKRTWEQTKSHLYSDFIQQSTNIKARRTFCVDVIFTSSGLISLWTSITHPHHRRYIFLLLFFFTLE